MRLLSKHIDFKNKLFRAKLKLDINTDDCWNLYNLMSVGDFVHGTCRRKITKDSVTGLVKN